LQNFSYDPCISKKHSNAGCSECLHRIGSAITGDDGFGSFRTYKLGGLDTGAATRGNALIIKDLKTHIVRFDQQKICASAEPRIDQRIKIPTAGTNGNFHKIPSFCYDPFIFCVSSAPSKPAQIHSEIINQGAFSMPVFLKHESTGVTG
jgi:hypothetical protein